MRTTHPFTSTVDEVAPFAIAEAPFGDTGVVLEVRGELDIATAPELRTRLASVIARGPEVVIVDLKAVDFLDSVSLALLLRAQKTLGEKSRMAVVVAPESYARLIFDITGVDGFLDVVGTREEAMER